MWPTKPKTFTTWRFTEHFVNPVSISCRVFVIVHSRGHVVLHCGLYHSLHIHCVYGPLGNSQVGAERCREHFCAGLMLNRFGKHFC